jgi:threonine synthase
MAAYGARAGFPVVLFTVSGIVDGKLRQILAHGATTHLVDSLGSRGDATSQVAPTIAALAAEHGWLPFLTGGKYLPDAMRGAETIAFELAEQRPDAGVVYVPVGGGGLLASIYRGYRRMNVTPPRLVGVQPAGCPTVGRALQGVTEPLPGTVTTTISGLQVPVLFDDDTVEAIRASGGWLVEIEDEQAWHAQRLLSREEGLYVEPAGATALAGLLADAADGKVDGDDAVVILSGAGHKDAAATERMGEDNPPRSISADGIAAAFAGLTR